MPVIEVKNLKKYYRVHQKEPGLAGSIKSLFHRKYYDAKAVDGVSFSIDEGELIGFIRFPKTVFFSDGPEKSALVGPAGHGVVYFKQRDL